MVNDLDLLEMIKSIKKAGIGDPKKLDFYHKIIADLGKSLQPRDRNYITDLYQEIINNPHINEKNPKFDFSENICEVKGKIASAKENYQTKAKNKIESSKFKLAGGKFCTRCENKLGFKKNKPEKSWGIQGSLCKNCFQYVKVNVTEYPAFYKQGQLRKKEKVKGKISIQNFDNTHRIVYGTKEFPNLETILASNVKNYQIINYEEYCKRKKIMTIGLRSTISLPHLLIQYTDKNNREQELILQIKDLSNAYNSVGNLVLSNPSEIKNAKQESFSEIKE